jgi:hypothetical protein
MAGVLVIFKRVRPSIEVQFYPNRGPLAQASDQAQLTLHTTTQRFVDDLTQIRYLYFPTIGDYTEWSNHPAIQAIVEDRTAWHAQHGIEETREVVSLQRI